MIRHLRLVVALLAAACVTADTTPLGCRGLFDCLAACSSSECEDACINRGTPQGLTLARSLATCSTTNACDTEDCLTQHCDSELRACAGLDAAGGGAGGGTAGGGTAGGGSAGGTAGGGAAGGSAGGSGGGVAGGVACSPGTGVPELTGPLTGLSASYAPGSMITVSVPVDADTARAQVTVYQYGGSLQLGSSASEVTSSPVTIQLYAGTMTAPTGTYYLSVDLCSTSLCTTPLVRNLYTQKNGDTVYTETRTRSGVGVEECSTGVPITSFRIE